MMRAAHAVHSPLLDMKCEKYIMYFVKSGHWIEEASYGIFQLHRTLFRHGVCRAVFPRFARRAHPRDGRDSRPRTHPAGARPPQRVLDHGGRGQFTRPRRECPFAQSCPPAAARSGGYAAVRVHRILLRDGVREHLDSAPAVSLLHHWRSHQPPHRK